MNYFNHQNVQLAYEAVYNQDLCESMEDLGLIGEYDELEEATRMRKYFDAKYGNKPDSVAAEARTRRKISGNKTPFSRPPIRGSDTHLRYSRQTSEQNESYELILDYLIQEGYADTLGSAEIILENMSDEWIEEILSESEYMGDTRRSARRLQQAAHKKAKRLKGDREEVERIFGDVVPKGRKEKTLSNLAFNAGLRAMGEEVEFYDIILEYLIQEGYADTLGSAEIILENMSDEWVEDILEAFVDPEEGENPSGRRPIDVVSEHPNKKVRKKAVAAMARQMGKEYGGRWKAKHSDPVDN